jgi:hypothetical protein|tara:strand:+ start:278 stop:460 length:183 start_codon:yes stop_codon:yes gene_type:complete
LKLTAVPLDLVAERRLGNLVLHWEEKLTQSESTQELLVLDLLADMLEFSIQTQLLTPIHL